MYASRTNCRRGSDGRTTHPPTHSLPSSRPRGSGETRDTERPAPLPSSFLSTFGNESKDINPHSNNTQRVSTAYEERTPGTQCWACQQTCFLPQTWIDLLSFEFLLVYFYWHNSLKLTSLLILKKIKANFYIRMNDGGGTLLSIRISIRARNKIQVA